jgi:hypothetical protein
VCHIYNSPLPIEQVMIACSKYDSERRKYFTHCNSLEDLFNLFRSNIIIDYMKEIGIHREL